MELSSKHLVNATSLPLASSKEIFTKKSEILFLIPMSVIIFSNIEFAWGSRPVSKIKMIYCSSWPKKKQRKNYSFRNKVKCHIYKQVSKNHETTHVCSLLHAEINRFADREQSLLHSKWVYSTSAFRNIKYYTLHIEDTLNAKPKPISK